MNSLHRTFLLAFLLSLTACGFHLRGSDLKSIEFAFKSLYLKAPAVTPFVADLRRSLDSARVVLTDAPDQADLVLEVVSEQTSRQILSLSGGGRVNEYQLFYRVSLRAYDRQRIDWLPAEEIALSRILAYSDEQVLAKEQEETVLYKDMRTDAVAQAMRRLGRAKPQE
ncbi:MAG: LPS assembly lipoprotein LptE [Gallionellaceae bacterium]|nr:LPS assembly lipoprotein LptE [Gallionellaceae bacterium]